MYNTFKDRDFYCSFTHLPQTSINLDELPYTIHSQYSIARLRLPPPVPPPPPHNPHQQSRPMHFSHHRRMPSALRPDSFDSANTANTANTASSKHSFTSFLSTSTGSSSHRKRRLLAKMKQPFETIFRSRHHHSQNPAAIAMVRASRKPSTLDFRCIGTTECSSAALFTVPVYDAPAAVDDAPKIKWSLPSARRWGEESWFEGIF